jgi:hypothetical protein
MFGVLEMLGGVTVGGTVATADVAADEAEPQMDPLSADLQAVFTTFGRGGYLLDFFNVFAGHGVL